MSNAIPSTTIHAPGPSLFNRSSTITVGTVQIQNIGQQLGLDAEFHVKRNLKPTEPNTCDLKIWNLSEDSRNAIAQASSDLKATIKATPKGPSSSKFGKVGSSTKVVPVQIVAGYVGDTATIFQGELRSAETVTEGTDTVTELTTGDGDDAMLLQRINQSFSKGSTAVQVVQALLAQMGVGQGNLQSVKPIFAAAPLFQFGGTVKGCAADRLLTLCVSVGLEFTVQGGQAQFLALGKPLAGEAYVLAPDSGLLGSPTVDTKGVLQCQTNLIASLAPGVPIEIDSAFVQGLFRITSITTKGSTFGNDWSHDIEAKSYGLTP